MSGEPLVQFELYPCYFNGHSTLRSAQLTQMAGSLRSKRLRRWPQPDITGQAGAATAAASAERLRCRRQASPLFHAQARNDGSAHACPRWERV